MAAAVKPDPHLSSASPVSSPEATVLDQPAPPPQKRKGGRKPVYATQEERKMRNRAAQAAFRERRTEYIKHLEATIKKNEEQLNSLQQSSQSAADEVLMLRYKTSLLERILVEKGIDVAAELQMQQAHQSEYIHPPQQQQQQHHQRPQAQQQPQIIPRKRSNPGPDVYMKTHPSVRSRASPGTVHTIPTPPEHAGSAYQTPHTTSPASSTGGPSYHTAAGMIGQNFYPSPTGATHMEELEQEYESELLEANNPTAALPTTTTATEPDVDHEMSYLPTTTTAAAHSNEHRMHLNHGLSNLGGLSTTARRHSTVPSDEALARRQQQSLPRNQYSLFDSLDSLFADTTPLRNMASEMGRQQYPYTFSTSDIRN